MDFNFGWDFENEDFFNAAEKKAEPSKKTQSAKKETKAAGEAAKKQEKEKPDYNCDVTLPVKVLARNFVADIEANTVMKLSDVCEELIRQGYSQMLVPGMELFYQKDMNTIYVSDAKIVASNGKMQVFEEEENSLLIADGQLKCELTKDDFPDKDYEEITLDDVISRWCAINTQYEGCQMYFDAEQLLLYPVIKNNPSSDVVSNMEIIVNGTRTEINRETFTEIKDMKDLVKQLAGDMGRAKAQIFKTSAAYFLSYDSGKEKAYCRKKAVSAKAVKEVETKYPLPLTLYVVTWNERYELTREMFDGKAKVSKEEITKFMAQSEKMFADKERKADYIYNEDKNLMSCMFMSGKKGAHSISCEEMGETAAHTGLVKLIRSAKELEECRKRDMFVGICCDMAESFILKALPHGNFYGYFGKEKECCTIKRVAWERKLPKIQRTVLDGIIQYFRRDLSKEAVVRILYNRASGEFFTIAAGGKRSKQAIEYDFTDVALCVSDVISVMEIHSHNTMPAYFSSVDDKDEKYPGIYGVIGNLDTVEPTMKFRAGFDGVFTCIDVEELFE